MKSLEGSTAGPHHNLNMSLAGLNFVKELITRIGSTPLKRFLSLERTRSCTCFVFLRRYCHHTTGIFESNNMSNNRLLQSTTLLGAEHIKYRKGPQSSTRLAESRAVVRSNLIAPVLPTFITTFTMLSIRLIWRLWHTLRLHVRLFIIGYVCWGTTGSRQVHYGRWASVLYLYFTADDCLLLRRLSSFHFHLLE